MPKTLPAIPGWERRLSSNGRPFYSHIASGAARWEPTRDMIDEMRAKFDEFNTTVPEEVRRRCVVMSFDVKSMYPSLRRSVCVAAVRDILSESPLEVEQVDMWALLRYVAITCTPRTTW